MGSGESPGGVSWEAVGGRWPGLGGGVTVRVEARHQSRPAKPSYDVVPRAVGAVQHF